MIAPPFARCLCLLRGGGDLGTGVAWRLSKAGFPVVVIELAKPLTVRRAVSLSSAVTDGQVEVEGLLGVRADTSEAMAEALLAGAVPVMTGVEVGDIDPVVVIDARLAKRNIDTSISDAPLVIALGPGFTAGVDCHAVIETQRGHRLGRALWSGAAAPNTGTPGVIGGRGAERVLRSPAEGTVRWSVEIGSRVAADQVLGHVDGQPVAAPFDGVVRGLILDGSAVTSRLKIGDVDPRFDVACDEISDKALAVGGGVLEAVTGWWSRRPEAR